MTNMAYFLAGELKCLCVVPCFHR